jgi:microcystin-dependent protein
MAQDPFVGAVFLFAGNFAPLGFALCAGQLLSISQNTELFSIIGTTYGGNGQTTFGLPDLRSRVPVGAGTGPGLSTYDLGEETGTETVTLNTSELPAHTHPLSAGTAQTTDIPASNAVPAQGGSYATSAASSMAPTGTTGQNVPHPNIQPVLTLNYIIALVGIFPSRN